VLFRLDKRRRALEAYRIECELGKITPKRSTLGPGLQDRVVRRLDPPFPCAPLQLGALGRRWTVGHRDTQLPVGRSPAVQTAMALHLRDPTEQRHGPLADRWSPVATSRRPSASASKACAICSTTPTYSITTSSTILNGTAISRGGVRCRLRHTDAGQLGGAVRYHASIRAQLSEDLLLIECHRRRPGVRSDQQVMAWLEELDKRVPNRVGVTPANVTRGTFGAAAGESAVPGDSAARDPRQLHVELSAVDAPPAGANIRGFPT